jgi:glycosyltransferase involved in cell wall biosynthesis
VFEALAMGKPSVSTDADGLIDVLTADEDALVVRRRDAAALAGAIVRMIDEPDTRVRLGQRALETGRRYDIAAFVSKMERLYQLLHQTSRATGRRGITAADVSFLTNKAPA